MMANGSGTGQCGLVPKSDRAESPKGPSVDRSGAGAGTGAGGGVSVGAGVEAIEL